MSLSPLLTAPFAIQLHVLAAVLAMALGPLALFRRRRDRLHRGLGYAWVGIMVTAAVSGLFIEAAVWPILGPFGPIHLLSLWVLYWLWHGVAAARRRDLTEHRATMRALYWQSLGIAALLTLLPGRLIATMVFPDAPGAGAAVVGLGVLLIAGRRIAARRQRGHPT